MKNTTALLLAVLIAVTLFPGPTALSQAGSNAEVTFYVH